MASQTEYLQLQLLGTSLQDKETYFEQWRQTINGEIDDSNMKIIDRACKQMADDIADLKYVPIAINSFTANPASAEKGSAVHNITFAYALNKVQRRRTDSGEIRRKGDLDDQHYSEHHMDAGSQG